jgi:hypothetical protein
LLCRKGRRSRHPDDETAQGPCHAVAQRAVAGLGERSVFYLAFDSAADADQASEALTNALNR